MIDEAERAARLARGRRAIARAQLVIKPGDRLGVTRCGGLIRTYRFTGQWERDWIICHPRLVDQLWWLWHFHELAWPIDDVSALSITHVNGRPVDFGNDGEVPW